MNNWKPVFGPNTPKLMDGTVEWIKAMMNPRPEYPVKYEPPNLKRNVEDEEGHPTQGAKPAR